MFLGGVGANAQVPNWEWARSAYAANGLGISTDVSGNVLVAGGFDGPMITFGSYTLTGGGAFLTKYDSSGNVTWAQSAVGNAAAHCVTTDANGNIYVAGGFGSSNITFGSDTLNYAY